MKCPWARHQIPPSCFAADLWASCRGRRARHVLVSTRRNWKGARVTDLVVYEVGCIEWKDSVRCVVTGWWSPSHCKKYTVIVEHEEAERQSSVCSRQTVQNRAASQYCEDQSVKLIKSNLTFSGRTVAQNTSQKQQLIFFCFRHKFSLP